MKLMTLKFQGPSLVQAPSKAQGGGGGTIQCVHMVMFLKNLQKQDILISIISVL